MKTIDQLLAIESKLEHLEESAQWIVRETVHSDSSVSQAATLISVLADDLREKMFLLVHDLECRIEEEQEPEILVH